MGSLQQERIAAYADTCANLLAQLNELAELHEQVRKAQLSPAMREPLKQRPVRVSKLALASYRPRW